MADFGDYVTPRDLELAADRARRIRALAAVIATTKLCVEQYKQGDYGWKLHEDRNATAFDASLKLAAFAIDALDALPVPERGK